MMNGNKHTPGPWIAKHIETDERLLDFVGETHWGLTSTTKNISGCILIAGLFGSNPSDADARLICAAPELLAAAKLALEYIDKIPAPETTSLQVADRFAAMRLREAIAKAEGK